MSPVEEKESDSLCCSAFILTPIRSGFGQNWGQQFSPPHSSGELPAGGAVAGQSGARVYGGEMFLRGGQGDFCPPATAGEFQESAWVPAFTPDT